MLTKIQRFFCSDDGNVIAFIAVGIMAVLITASLSIDIGGALAVKNQLQVAADAAALAGAAGLMTSQTEARNQASYFASRNKVLGNYVGLASGDISFPTSSKIRVVARYSAPAYFIRVAGIHQIPVQATATAELAGIVGTTGMRPFAVPGDNWDPGDPVIIKVGDPQDKKETDPGSFFYGVCFPPMNRGNPEKGGSVYRDNIADGSDYMVYIGDQLLVEPGNMVGPTKQGIAEIIATDPNAYWDTNQNKIVNSSYSGFDSPRVIKVPCWDPNYPPGNGRSSLIVTNIAAFFVETIVDRNVYGRFINILSTGVTGNGETTLFKPRLCL